MLISTSRFGKFLQFHYGANIGGLCILTFANFYMYIEQKNYYKIHIGKHNKKEKSFFYFIMNKNESNVIERILRKNGNKKS